MLLKTIKVMLEYKGSYTTLRANCAVSIIISLDVFEHKEKKSLVSV